MPTQSKLEQLLPEIEKTGVRFNFSKAESAYLPTPKKFEKDYELIKKNRSHIAKKVGGGMPS